MYHTSLNELFKIKCVGNSSITKGSTYKSGSVQYLQYGRIVILNIYDLVCNAVATMSGNNAIIATGLPVPFSTDEAIGVIHNIGSSGVPARVSVTSSGNLVLYWQTISDSSIRTGQLVYLTNSLTYS